MLFGLNDANPAVPGQSLQRTYHTPEEGVPPAWDRQTPAGILPVDSIRPPADQVAAGTLDAQLSAYWSSLPPGALVTIWHEGNDPNEHQDAPTLLAAHERARTIADGLQVHYGVIVGAYPLWHLGQQLSAWVPPLGRFHWLSCDGYANAWDKPAATPEGIFGPFIEQAKASRPHPRLLITETNVNVTLQAQQADWMSGCLTLAIENQFLGFCAWENTQRVPDVAALPAELLAQLAARCNAAPLTRGLSS